MKQLIIIIGLTLSVFSCNSQTKKTHKLSGFERHEVAYLKIPFKGIATSNGKLDGLYPLKSTGVSTTAIVKAATNFINELTSSQKTKTLFPFNDIEWRKWCNVDNGIYHRQGIPIKEMNQVQRKKADQLLKESLSLKGFKLTKNIMKTDQTLRELNDNDPVFDEDLYFFTIMGTPSKTAPWGWQLDGHHLVINYFVLGDQIVMTPTFMGAEPVIATAGKHKGNTLFQDEQNLGLKFMQSLPKFQQKTATLSSNKGRHTNKGEAFSDNITVNYEGIQANKLSTEHQEKLLALIYQYISNMTTTHAQVKMSEVKKYLNDTYFAWVGKTDDDAVFYYRIYSPVVLIEFDHQGPVGAGRGRKATRNHIHTVVRTPNGNDYGKDLLKQHIEKHHKH